MFKGFSRLEWRVISVSLFLMMVCAFLLSNEKALELIGINASKAEAGARLITLLGDVRVKSESEAKWQKAKSKILVGENIFIGDNSSAELELRSGARLSIPSKAILRIARIEGVPTLDMLAGKFVWSFSGPQSVAIKGARGTLSGQDAQLEISVDPGASDHQVRTLAGNGQLQIDKTASAPEESDPPKVLPSANSTFFYVWRLEDYYSLNDQNLSRKASPSSEVTLEVTLNWEHPSSGPFNIQVSRSQDLTQDRRFYSTVDPSITLEKAFLGENFWRVGFANTAWSQVQTFKVEPRFLEAKIEPAAGEHKLNLRSQSELMLRWNFSSDMASYIAEISEDAQFADGKGELKFLNSPEFVQELPKPVVLYARIRGLNSRQEITDWSPATKITAR